MLASRVASVLLAGALVTSTALAEAAPVRVFIMAGQSNMVGYGEGSALPAELQQQADVWYDHHNPDARDGGDYADATSTEFEPLGPMGVALRYGPEITFGRAIADAFPGDTIVIVKMSQGGTNILEHWARGLPQDPEYVHKSQLYHALLGTLDSQAGAQPLAYPDEVTRLDTALARLDARGLAYELSGFIWMQGENEANWSAAYGYEATLIDFIGAVREDLGAPSLPFVIGRISDNLYAANGGPIPAGESDQIDTVRAAQVAVADADPEVEWVDTDDLEARPGDAWHLSSDAYQTLGARFAASYLALHPPGSGSGGGSTTATGGGEGGGGPSGAGGAAATGAGATTTAGAGPSGSGGSSAAPDEGGCAVSGDAAGSRATTAWSMLLAALVARAFTRRRRTRHA